MPPAIIYGYYYKYKAVRNNLKDLVTNDNLEEATTKISQYLVEHDNYIENVTNSDFTKTDNSSLHHAKDHLNAYTMTSDPFQKNRTIRALDEG